MNYTRYLLSDAILPRTHTHTHTRTRTHTHTHPHTQGGLLRSVQCTPDEIPVPPAEPLPRRHPLLPSAGGRTTASEGGRPEPHRGQFLRET